MDYLPIAKINTVVFCPRRFYLEHLLGEVHRNHHLIEGSFLHDRAHTESGERSNLWVWSDRLLLVGIVDRIEYHKGLPVLVEYKRSKAHDEAHHSDAVQLAAQALCLEESRQRVRSAHTRGASNMGQRVEQGYVYYHGSRTRREVTFTPELRAEVERAVAQMRTLLASPLPPPVQVPKSKCEGCSTRLACQPELWRKRKGVE